MKKIALLLLFVSFLLDEAAAQKGIRFGIQASPAWSWLRTNDRKIEGVGSNWGFKTGVLCDYFFHDKYAISTGIGFGFNHGGTLQNGYAQWKPWDLSDVNEIPSDTFSIDAKLHHRITYVEIPFGLKMRGGSGEDAKIKFYAEPLFTLGFVTKGVGDIRGTNTQNFNDLDIRNEIRGLSLSWGIGGGIEYELFSDATLVAGLAYQHQFTDVTKDGYVEKTPGKWEKEETKVSFSNIALKIGVLF